jgi:hypothetical protein
MSNPGGRRVPARATDQRQPHCSSMASTAVVPPSVQIFASGRDAAAPIEEAASRTGWPESALRPAPGGDDPEAGALRRARDLGHRSHPRGGWEREGGTRRQVPGVRTWWEASEKRRVQRREGRRQPRHHRRGGVRGRGGDLGPRGPVGEGAGRPYTGTEQGESTQGDGQGHPWTTWDGQPDCSRHRETPRAKWIEQWINHPWWAVPGFDAVRPAEVARTCHVTLSNRARGPVRPWPPVDGHRPARPFDDTGRPAVAPILLRRADGRRPPRRRLRVFTGSGPTRIGPRSDEGRRPAGRIRPDDGRCDQSRSITNPSIH